MIAAIFNSHRMDYSHGYAKFYETLEELAKNMVGFIQELNTRQKTIILSSTLK